MSVTHLDRNTGLGRLMEGRRRDVIDIEDMHSTLPFESSIYVKNIFDSYM